VEHPAQIQLHSSVPTFLVDDVDATADWYGRELGFSVAGIVPPRPPSVWASLQRDGAELMLLRLPGYRKPALAAERPGGVWDVYFRTNGVSALYETVRGKPFIKMQLRRQTYGDWEFEVQDPNGYVLVFGGGAETPAVPPVPNA
jgi:catechol 2,3-dioxygenase-like lactoylglutathione lyase family enzyme